MIICIFFGYDLTILNRFQDLRMKKVLVFLVEWKYSQQSENENEKEGL